MNVINLDVRPFIPDGWHVVEHRKGGQFEWDAAKVALHLSPNQKEDKAIEGNKLRKELEEIPIFNANLLDYLLLNPHLIPEEWKNRDVCFWGTIYCFADVYVVIRYLRWDSVQAKWYSRYIWLENRFGSGTPALVFAS